MQYAKLVDDYNILIAPVNYTTDDGQVICNFNSNIDVMFEQGFRPLVKAPKPDYPYIISYVEADDEIREIITKDEEEIERQKQEEIRRINNLKMTKADFWIALLDKGVTKQMVKDKINLIPDEILREKTLIRIDDADNFWRGDASMNVVGSMFGITPEELNYLFEHKEFPPEVTEEE